MLPFGMKGDLSLGPAVKELFFRFRNFVAHVTLFI